MSVEIELFTVWTCWEEGEGGEFHTLLKGTQDHSFNSGEKIVKEGNNPFPFSPF